MSEKVISLVPNRNYAPTAETMAARLEEYAASIRAGDWPELERIVLVLDTGATKVRIVGRECNNAEMVGLLQYAIFRTMTGDVD